jgi:uncharacterized protein (DUF362 family)
MRSRWPPVRCHRLESQTRRMSDTSRRDFLKATAGAAVAVAAVSCRSRPYRREDFPVPARSSVALLPASDYSGDLADLVGRGLRELGVDVRGRRVLLKPNMVEYHADSPINTHPHVVAAAASALLSAGAARVVVGEGPGHRRDIEYLLDSTGTGDVIDDLRLQFVDLNSDDVRQVPLRSNYTRLGSVWLPVSLLDADFVVSLPKLKTHHYAGMTGSMKNFFGVVPGAVYGWPKNVLHFHRIEYSIVDLVATVTPSLTILDGIIGMEGDGPIMGRARPVGFIAMGTDLAAVDATCARIIGLDPDKMLYLSLAGDYLGNIDPRRIDQRGERPERYASEFDVIDAIRSMRLTRT